MKNTTAITKDIALDILGTEENTDYILWEDGSQIEFNELINEFEIEVVDMANNLVHKTADFRIENIALTDCYC
jgi:hypothetical protein